MSTDLISLLGAYCQRTTLTGHSGEVFAVAVAPNGNSLVSGSGDGTVRIWDVASGQARALMRLDNPANAAAWVNTGMLAVGGPAGLYLFDFLRGVNTAASEQRE